MYNGVKYVDISTIALRHVYNGVKYVDISTIAFNILLIIFLVIIFTQSHIHVCIFKKPVSLKRILRITFLHYFLKLAEKGYKFLKSNLKC